MTAEPLEPQVPQAASGTTLDYNIPRATGNSRATSNSRSCFLRSCCCTTTWKKERSKRKRQTTEAPLLSTNVGDQFFVEKVDGCSEVERGHEFFLIKWSGYSDYYITWEDGVEKRREIPNMVTDYFTELGVDDDVIMRSNYEDVNDHTYVNRRSKRRRLL